VTMGTATSLRMDPAIAREVLDTIVATIDNARAAGSDPVLVTSPSVRRLLKQLVQCEMKNLPVLSLSEVPDWVDVDVINMIPAPQMSMAGVGQ